MDRLLALYMQVKILYYLIIYHNDYEKTVKAIYNELERYL